MIAASLIVKVPYLELASSCSHGIMEIRPVLWQSRKLSKSLLASTRHRRHWKDQIMACSMYTMQMEHTLICKASTHDHSPRSLSNNVIVHDVRPVQIPPPIVETTKLYANIVGTSHPRRNAEAVSFLDIANDSLAARVFHTRDVRFSF